MTENAHWRDIKIDRQGVRSAKEFYQEVEQALAGEFTEERAREVAEDLGRAGALRIVILIILMIEKRQKQAPKPDAQVKDIDIKIQIKKEVDEHGSGRLFVTASGKDELIHSGQGVNIVEEKLMRFLTNTLEGMNESIKEMARQKQVAALLEAPEE